MKLYSSLQHRLESQHLAIAEIIRNLPPPRLLLRPAIDKWNIHDIIAHLAKYQVVFIDRINKIVKEELPHFERYVAEEDPGFELFRKKTDAILLDHLNEQRIRLTSLVTNLSEDDLQRKGVHKKYGNLTVIQWTEFFLLHEAHHLFAIFRLANDSDLK